MLLHSKCCFFWDRYETNIHSRNRNKTHNHIKFVYLLLFERGEITMNVRKKGKFIHIRREEVTELGKLYFFFLNTNNTHLFFIRRCKIIPKLIIFTQQTSK